MTAPAAPRDICHAVLFGANGKDRLAWLPNAINFDVTAKLNTPDAVSFEVPVDDPTTSRIHERRIVRATWYHDGIAVQRSACRIKDEASELVVNGRRMLRFENQPGLLAMEGDGNVYPEYGLAAHGATERLFGMMSKAGPWLLDHNWITPVAVSWANMTGVRKGHPPELKRNNPDWIASISPRTFVPGSTANYYRAHPLTLTATKRAQWVCTGDNFTTGWHNGEEIITPDPSNSLMWRQAYNIPLTLHAGTHLFTAEVRNAPRATFGGASPIGFIGDLYEVDDSGKILGVLLETNSADWKVHDNTPEPGWFAGQVLKTLHVESQGRGEAGPSLLGLQFGDFHDSAGRAFTQRLPAFPVQIGNVSLLDVIKQLTEAGGMDVTVDTLRMNVQVWNRLGRNRYSTVEIKPANEGGNAASISATKARTRVNSLLTRLSDGTLIEVRNQASVDAWGVISGGLSVAAGTVATATAIANAQLAESAQSRTTVEVELDSQFGLVPGKHFFLGDSVKCRDTRNVPFKGRVMSINWKLGSPVQVPQVFIEIVEDLT